MKMKSYLTEWKKWKSVLIEFKTPEQIAKEKAKLAAEEAAALAAKAEAEKKAAQELKTKTGTSGTSSTAPTMEEELDGRPEGTMGKQPGDSPDKINITVRPTDSLAVVGNEELTEEELEEASGCHEGLDEAGQSCQLELQYEEIEEEKQCNECRDCTMCGLLTEAKLIS